MFNAVHTDRSGNLFVSADYGAAGFNGAVVAALVEAVPLPRSSALLPLADAPALGIDHAGRARRLGAGRWALSAVVPPGHLRTALPAHDDGSAPLEPRGYAAIGADEQGELVVAAVRIDEDTTHDASAYGASDLAARVSAALRERPSNRLLRQLARCAREYGCHAATNAFYGRWEYALPVAAAANEHPPAVVAPRRDEESAPTEPATFHADATEIAECALAHLAAGGTLLSFGRACEGEPLLAARLVEEAIRRIRAASDRGTIHLETNGSQPVALRRVLDAGLESVSIRLMSARPETYEALHGPSGYRFSDVRASLDLAGKHRFAMSLSLRVLPGLSDRPAELDALLALLAELPEGSALLLRDLAADPRPALALVPSNEAPLGMVAALERLRAEAPHVRLATFPRPLARI